MKDSYLTAGIKFNHLFRLLKRNKVSFTFRNLLRLAFLLQGACWSSLFSWIEKVRFSKALKNTPVPDDPVFIIGHWRTGSTLLHQLMSLDPQLNAPTLFQVALPDSFLVSYPYYRPMFRMFISGHRPMDQVRIGMDEPQEDEYAIYRITNFSPLEKLVFATTDSYFLNRETRFLPSGDDLEKWKNEVKAFFRKLHFANNKRIVSKNPFNSFRIKVLHDMFPNAKFIHIVCHPDDVIPSAINMWNILQKQNQLTNPVNPPRFEAVADLLEHLLSEIETDHKQLLPDQYVEVRFEDLEKKPVAVLKQIYESLHLPFSTEFELKINGFIRQTANFRKNDFSLTPRDKLYIRKILAIHMNKYNYQ